MTGQYIEYAIIFLISTAVLFGLLKGFEKIFFSWFNVVLGLLFAGNFSYGLTEYLFPKLSNNFLAVGVTGIVLFIFMYLILTNISYLLVAFLKKSNLSVVNNLLGAFFAALQMTFLLGLILYWVIELKWVDMKPYPVSMFVFSWTKQYMFILKAKLMMLNKMFR